MCFLDGKQAFDRVWHLGMLYKLHSCVDQTTFSAIRNMYDNTTSCVSNQGLTSDWFPILQGTRQGGNSSPYIYLVYIDGLIKELEKWAWSFFILLEPVMSHGSWWHGSNIAVEEWFTTEVEHMPCVRVQVAIWIQPLKCGVIVFNEMSTKQVHFSQWNIGSAQICEVDDYTRLGITCNKFMDNSMCIQYF